MEAPAIFMLLIALLLFGTAIHYVTAYVISAVRAMRGAAMSWVTVIGLLAAGVFSWLGIIALSIGNII